ncbi:hypothetical protein E6R41_17285 [Citrobacter freundii]|uniref:hypothetical protein n=1 Tax=Citrobacter freundii TaxID=546 RepID=UPI00109D78A9|nr:hypothetical protein [Citrobacter freundii]THB07215.1 hypothetical protein E6R41_17285 [Citrobacter freundii]HBB9912954.1 hypothetical protein [Citrobacter freundii]
MYSLLLKDRAYPITMYLAYMTRVKGLTRAQAIELLTYNAVKLGLRKDSTPPASNTVARWGKTTDVPLWAIVTAMYITDRLGKIPFLDKEWAFWSYSTSERGIDKTKYTGIPYEWLNTAYNYKKEYELRAEYRKRFKSLSYPDIASKIVIFYRGNNLESVNIPTLFFGLSNSFTLNECIDDKLNSGNPLTDDDVSFAIAKDDSNARLYDEIVCTLKELAELQVVTHLCKGYIAVS